VRRGEARLAAAARVVAEEQLGELDEVQRLELLGPERE